MDISATLSRMMIRHVDDATAATTQLRLTPVGGGEAVVLSATEANNYSATFSLPMSLPFTQYTATVSNNGGSVFANISTFRSPTQPRVSTVTVRPPLAFKNDTFIVERPPPGHRVPGCKGRYGTKPGDPGRATDSLPAVRAACAAAALNGGGTVFFPRGQYWLSGPLVVPPGVVVKGEGTDLVSIYFKEQTPLDAPTPSYVYSGWSSEGNNSRGMSVHNATGPITVDPSISSCGPAGCCIAPPVQGSSAAPRVVACDGTAQQSAQVTATVDGTGLTISWAGRCLAPDGHGGVTLATCDAAALTWSLQCGYVMPIRNQEGARERERERERERDSHELTVSVYTILPPCLPTQVDKAYICAVLDTRCLLPYMIPAVPTKHMVLQVHWKSNIAGGKHRVPDCRGPGRRKGCSRHITSGGPMLARQQNRKLCCSGCGSIRTRPSFSTTPKPLHDSVASVRPYHIHYSLVQRCLHRKCKRTSARVFLCAARPCPRKSVVCRQP